MKNFKKSLKKVLCILLAVAMLGTINISAFASANSEESSNLDDPTAKNYRAYLEYLIPNGSSGTTAGIVRQNVMHTYLKAGESVYFGSSMWDSKINLNGDKAGSSPTGCDIVVTYPDGGMHSFDVIQNGAGYIDRRVEAETGPIISISDTNPDKYIPLSFTAEVSGLYDFSFRSRTGAVAAPTPVRVKDSDAAAMTGQKDSDVAFWDITVADQDGNEITGRTYSTYLALSTGKADHLMDALYYIVTNDGYIYKSEFEDIQPFGFVFFSNNQGITTIGETASSVYHSVYDDQNTCENVAKENVTFHHPNAPDTEFEQTNLIFYEKPSKDLVGVLFGEPAVPKSIEEVKFFGHEDGKTYYTQGGTFQFESHGATSVSLAVDFNASINDTLEHSTDKRIIEAINAYRQAGGTGIVEINGATTDGINTFAWDGKDNNNIHMPVGVYNAREITITAKPKAGEIHFPFLDVEGCYKGIHIERLNGIGGRDSVNPSDDRFGICYNNSPLKDNTIEGFADPSVKPVLDESSYYMLSDGTRTYKIGSLGGATYFTDGYTNNGLTYTIKNENISTLIKNPNYADPTTVTEAVEETQPKYIHQPVDSRNTSVIYGQNGDNGGGNRALVDVWAYYEGETVNSIKFKTEIEIIDDQGVGELSGFVFYDDYANGKYNKTYQPKDGDYPLADIKVNLVDSAGNKLQVMNEKGYSLYTDSSTGKSVFETQDGNYVDENDNPVSCDQSKLQPVYYTTVTDGKGYYSFKGVYYGSGQSKTFYVQTEFTEAQQNAYNLCTTENDFKTGKQQAVLSDSAPSKKFGDIGYTAKNIPLTELTVTKVWDSEIKEKKDMVYVKLYQESPTTGKKTEYDSVILSATNGWKHTFINLNKTYKYYIEEYVDDGMGDYDLVGTSESKLIDPAYYDGEITSSTTPTCEHSGYFANFTFNPNIVGPTIEITNKEIIHDYRVVYHNNFDGHSNINTEDYFRIYCRENAIPTVKRNTGFDDVYALSDLSGDGIHQYQYTIDAFYDIPERENYVFTGWYYEPSFDEGSKVFKWTTDDFSGDNDADHDGDKYTMTDNNVYHLYAHWVPVSTVVKDSTDEKRLISGTDTGVYGGYDLFGVQIRDYRFDPNYDNGDTYYTYKKEVKGLRFVTSIRDGLLSAVNDAFDTDAQEEYYDYADTKNYVTKSNSVKDSNYIQNLDYGYVVATEIDWTDHYNGFTKNRAYYDKYGLAYNITNNNGVDTSRYYRFVKNVECTSSIDGYNAETSILDHRNYDDYRIMSTVITYNGLTDKANMNNNVIARPYLKYIDANGLDRIFYTTYRGQSAKAKGCLISYNKAYDIIKDNLEGYIGAIPNSPITRIGGPTE